MPKCTWWVGSLRADSGGRAGGAQCSLPTGEVPWLSQLPGLLSPWQCHKSSLLEEGAWPSYCLFQLLKEAFINASTYSSLKLHLVCHSLCLQALMVKIALNFCSLIFVHPSGRCSFEEHFKNDLCTACTCTQRHGCGPTVCTGRGSLLPWGSQNTLQSNSYISNI